MLFSAPPRLLSIPRWPEGDAPKQRRGITAISDDPAQTDFDIQCFQQQDLALLIPLLKCLLEAIKSAGSPKAAQAIEKLDSPVDLTEQRIPDRELGCSLDQVNLKERRQLRLCGQRFQGSSQFPVLSRLGRAGSIELS